MLIGGAAFIIAAIYPEALNAPGPNDAVLPPRPLDPYLAGAAAGISAQGFAGGGIVGGFGARSACATADVAVTVGREISLVNGFYQAEGSAFKFSEYYYTKLWATGRGAPFLQAEEVLDTATTITVDRKPGFYRYTNDFFEMVYNPGSNEVWHIMPIRR